MIESEYNGGTVTTQHGLSISSGTSPEDEPLIWHSSHNTVKLLGEWCQQASLRAENHCSKDPSSLFQLFKREAGYWKRRPDSFSHLSAFLADTRCERGEERRWSEEQWETKSGSANASWPVVTGKLRHTHTQARTHTHTRTHTLSLLVCLLYKGITHTLYSDRQRGGFREVTHQQECEGWRLRVGWHPPCWSVSEQDTFIGHYTIFPADAALWLDEKHSSLLSLQQRIICLQAASNISVTRNTVRVRSPWTHSQKTLTLSQKRILIF